MIIAQKHLYAPRNEKQSMAKKTSAHTHGRDADFNRYTLGKANYSYRPRHFALHYSFSLPFLLSNCESLEEKIWWQQIHEHNCFYIIGSIFCHRPLYRKQHATLYRRALLQK